MPNRLTLDQVGAMFASGPVKSVTIQSSSTARTDDRAIVFQVSRCELCGGDVYTVLPEDPDDVRVLRLVHASCVDF
jgi:hypothetical protein